MKLASRTMILDRGWNGIASRMKQSNRSFTKIGLPADGSASGTKSMGELIEIGISHEWGSPSNNLPERPFMRQSVDKRVSEIEALVKQQWSNVLLGMSPRQALSFIGEKVQEMIVAEINAGQFHELSKAYQEKTGRGPFEHILIDTGAMRDSIQHKEVINGL